MRVSVWSRLPALLVFCLIGLGARRAEADAAPPRERPSSYYVAHSGVVAGLFAGGLLIRLTPRSGPGPDWSWFPGDFSVRGRHSANADRLSDMLIAATVTGPAFAKLGQGADLSLANAGLVYGETLSANLVLNAFFKVVFSRPRPYTYGDFAKALGDEDDGPYASFYSGHASASFAAAVAGSYLFAEQANDRASRCVLWGTELGLASATAMLRVRAGKHYYSDIVVGALAGSAFGVLIPLAHGASHAPEALEYISGGAGIVAGATLASVFPFRRERRLAAYGFDWSLRPFHGGAGAHGLEVSGGFD
jgi:membrane-associated phospholipid phosphatase